MSYRSNLVPASAPVSRQEQVNVLLELDEALKNRVVNGDKVSDLLTDVCDRLIDQKLAGFKSDLLATLAHTRRQETLENLKK